MGVSSNEKAGILAKAAARRPASTQFFVPAEDLCLTVTTCVHRCWQERWNDVGPNKLRNIQQGTEKWSYQGMLRRWETELVSLCIGHTKMTHGHLMNQSSPPFCDDCLVPLTVCHLLTECPSLGEFCTAILESTGQKMGRTPSCQCLERMRVM